MASDPASPDQFGSAVALAPDTASVGAPNKRHSASYGGWGAGYLFSRTGSVWTHEKKVTSPILASFYGFGISVALSGDYAFFGARGEDTLINGSYQRKGRLHLIRRVAGTWGSVESRHSPYVDGSEGWFGATIGVDGDLLAVGGGMTAGATHFLVAQGGVWPSAASRITVDGAALYGLLALSGDRAAATLGYIKGVQLLSREGGSWRQELRIMPDAPELPIGGSGGYDAVAMDGDWLAFQSWRSYGDGVGGDRMLHTYQRGVDGWRHRGDPPLRAEYNAFSYSRNMLALSGRTLVSGKNVHVWNGTAWIQQAVLEPPGGASLQFGVSVAVLGERVLVGAPDVQKVFLFERGGTTWNAVAEFDCPGMEYGSAIALGDDAVYVGAPGDSTFGTGTGCVYVSLWDGNGWGKMVRLGAPDSKSLGGTISAHGRWLAVGASTEAGSAGNNVGAAYLFYRTSSRWRQPRRLAPAVGATWDQFGELVAMHSNRLLVACPGDDVPDPATGIVHENKGSIHSYRLETGAVIEVLGNGQQIVPGETRANAATHTWFGAPTTVGGEVLRTFTIRNPGDVALALAGSPRVRVSGPHAADFTVVQQPIASVAVGGATSFQIRFRPGAAGWRTAQVSIVTNDTEAAEFQFVVQGASAPAMAASFASPGVDAFTLDSSNVTGMTLQLSLGHVPQTGAELTVIRNNGYDFIEGEFTNLPQGGEVALFHNKRTYRFIADYFGGDGNDLTLVWKHRRLYGWGNNADSLTGDGQIATNKPVPGPATSIEAFAATHGKFIKHVDAGSRHGLVLFMDGSLAAWGHALYGYLGDGTVGSPTTVITSPVWVDTGGVLQGRRVVRIAAGDYHNMVLCSDGTLAAWGVNMQGQLGDGTKVNKLLPVDAWPLATAGLPRQPAYDVAVGPYHSLLQHRDGTLSYVGYYSGNPGQALTFKPVPAEPGLSALAGRKVRQLDAKRANAALCTDGAVVFWIDGALSAPTLVPADATSGSALFGKVVTQITAGSSGGFALTSDGIITNWGRVGTYGNESAIPQAVNNGPGSALHGRVPVSVSTTYDTYGHSIAVCSDGMLVAWGFNNAGQLGDGTLTTRENPVLVGPGVLGPGERFTHAWASGYSTGSFTHAFVASPPPPDLVATGDGVAIPDGDTTPQAADLTDFGPVGIGGGSVTSTFAIQNTGAGSLSLTGSPRVLVQGAHPQDFIVVMQPPGTVAANGGLASFNLRFAPTTVGERRATLVIASDEGGGRTQRFDVRGIGATGHLVIEEPVSFECLPGGVRDFGTQARGSATAMTFTLRNDGEATLYGIGAMVGGGDAGNFVVTSPPPGELAPGQSAAFTVTFAPQWVGDLAGVLRVASSDPFRNPFEIQLRGRSGLPDIAVAGPAGNSLGSGWGDVDVGVARVGFPGSAKTFTIRNDGAAPLTGLAVSLTGVTGTEFTLDTTSTAASLASGASTTFRVNFRPGGPLIRRAALVIESTDPDENPFNVAIRGMGLNVGAFLSTSRIGDAPGGEIRSEAFGLSGAGDIVVGVTGGAGDQGFRWTRSGGMELLPSVGITRAWGISRDGSTIVGEVLTGDGLQAARWRSGGWAEVLVPISGLTSSARSVSADGTFITGSIAAVGGPGVMRWSEAGGVQVLGFLPGGVGTAAGGAISDDGGTIAGYSPTNWHSHEALRWTPSGGMQGLGFTFFLGTASEAVALSGDGRVAVGWSEDWMGKVAVCWLPGGGAQPLGDLPGGTYHSAATAITRDGAFIGGWGTAATGRRPTLWHGATGLLDLRELIEQGGANLAGWSDLRVAGISDNADIVLMNGINPEGHPDALVVRGLNSAFTLSGSYAAAAAAAGLHGSAAGPMAAPMGDGVPNLLKYASNMDLKARDHRRLIPGIGTAGLPHVSVVGTGATRKLRIEYVRRKSGGLVYVAQKSVGMDADWLAMVAAPSVTSIDAEWDRVVIEETVAGDRWFARLAIRMP